jgi:hypothetical protein
MDNIMFVIGIMIMIASALLFAFTREPVSQITILLIIGIVLAAASRFRLRKT